MAPAALLAGSAAGSDSLTGSPSLDLLIPVFPFLVIVAAFWIVLHFRRNPGRKQEEILTQISCRRGGAVNRGNVFIFPTLVFPHGSREISVHSTPSSKNTPPRTRVSCQLDLGRDIRMSVCRETFIFKAAKIFGALDIEVGNGPFDREFVVRGDDEAAVKSLRTPAVQERLVGLVPKGMSLSLTPRELGMVIDTIPAEACEYDPILDAFTAVVDSAAGGSRP